MNTDIRLSVDFFRNIKVRKLKRALGAEGVLSLQALWLFCAENVPDGNLGKYSEDIEFIVEWDGEEGAFVSALLSLGFLDEEADGTFLVHDWSENNPYVAASEARADAGRLARLKRENPEAARRLEAEGRTGITSAEYQAAKYKRSSECNDEGTYVGTLNQPSKVPTTNLEGKPQGDLEGSAYSSTSTNTSNNINIYPQDTVGNKGGMGGEEPTPAPKRRDGGGEQEQMLTDYTPEEREVLSLFKSVHDLKQPDTGKLIRQIRTLKADFPAVDLLAEAKKMALWLDSREKKQNAKSNLLLFMRNWVERASKTPSPPISDLQRYKNGPPPVPNADGSIGKADEGNAERNKRLAEKYMKQFGDRMTGGEAP